MFKRYAEKITNAVGTALAYPIVRRREQESRGYANMAELVKLKRKTGGRIIGNDYRDPLFRMTVRAQGVADDIRSPDRAKLARRYYQTMD